jgi:opacity protein-like surface antigen
MTRFLLVAAVAVTAVAGSSADDAKTVITKAIKAAGWDKEQGEYFSWKEKGKMHGPTGKHRMEFSIDAGGGQKFDVTFRFDGKRAFESAMGMSREVDADKRKYTRNTANLFRCTSLKPLLTSTTDKIVLVETGTVNKRATIGVKVTTGDLRPVTMYFDLATNLIVKTSVLMPNEFDGWKDATDEAYYDDWKDVGGGVKNFTSLRVDRDGKKLLESKLSDYKVHEKPDWAETAFAK